MDENYERVEREMIAKYLDSTNRVIELGTGLGIVLQEIFKYSGNQIVTIDKEYSVPEDIRNWCHQNNIVLLEGMTVGINKCGNVYTISDLISKYKEYYNVAPNTLVMDIEGIEWELLDDWDTPDIIYDNFEYIIAELHFGIKNDFAREIDLYNRLLERYRVIDCQNNIERGNYKFIVVYFKKR